MERFDCLNISVFSSCSGRKGWGRYNVLLRSCFR